MSGTQGRKIGAQESIRKFCVACMGGSHVLVAQCECAECALYAYRHMRQENRRPPLLEHTPEGCEAAQSPHTGANAENSAEHLTGMASEVQPSPAALQAMLAAPTALATSATSAASATSATSATLATPAIRAIRRQCLHCCCGDRAQVRACAASPKSQPPFEPCLLWRFRLGSRPEILERRLRKARNTPLVLPGLTMPGKNG